ncbi:MAG: hypothetical protein AB7U82_29130 [Blastocatellales bacterium]
MDLKLLSRQGMSIRAIACHTGLSRNTVRQALRATTPAAYKQRPVKERKIDQHLNYLRDQLERRPWIPASQLAREIEAQGYRGCYELVKVACRKFRREQQARHRACVRFETGPLPETVRRRLIFTSLIASRSNRSRMSRAKSSRPPPNRNPGSRRSSIGYPERFDSPAPTSRFKA